MHYRITKVKHDADKRDEIIRILNEKESIIASFEGLNWVKMISISDTETMAISEYGTEAQLKAVEGRFREVMVDLVPLMKAPPEVCNGDAFWVQKL